MKTTSVTQKRIEHYAELFISKRSIPMQFINLKTKIMNVKFYFIPFTILLMCMFSLTSSGQMNPFAPARNFVIFVEDSMVVYGKENKTNNANGGNFIMAGPSGYNTGSNGVGNYVAGSDPLPTSTYIGGMLKSPMGGTMKIQGNAYVKIGNTSNVNCIQNGNTIELYENANKILYASGTSQACNTLSQMGDLNIPSAFSQMRSISQCLALQADNVSWNSAGFVDVSAHRYNFLTLTVAQLDSNWKLTTNSDANHFLVINVKGNGTAVHLINGGFDTKGDPRYDMLNVTNIPSLYFDNMQSNFTFSIMAPNTHGYFDDKEQHGQLVFQNYNQTDKIYQHGVPYLGEFQCTINNQIGDFVWDDNDNTHNGIQDAGEPGISNVVVTLYTCTGSMVAQTTTNGQGKYFFNNVPAGNYKIGFSNLPAGYLFTTKGAGTPANNNDANLGTGITDCFTVFAGQNNYDIDAGAFSGGGVTPVNIGQFQGKYESGVSKLNWETYTENNIVLYEVQRSIDGINFIPIGNVQASVSPATTNIYNFTDKLPYAGTNYYRLKIIDKNASVGYSNIIALSVTIKGINIRNVYPNPFAEYIGIDITAENQQTVIIRLTDYSGRVLIKQTHISQKGTSTFFIKNLRSFSSGMYVIEVRAGDKILTKKLNK